MARTFATIKTSIWGNPDVRALPLAHQGLYLQLWTHPDVSYAGVVDWRPGRSIAPLSAGSTADSIRELIPMLEEKLFVIVDEDTEELLLRSYFRHDELMKNPKTAVSMANAYAAVGSNMLRGVIVHELQRLEAEFPEWKGWAPPQVAAMLRHPSIDPRTLHPTPSVTGSVTPSVTPYALGSVTPSVTPFPTTTSTTTGAKAPSSDDALDVDGLDDDEDRSGPPLARRRLPKSWVPSPTHYVLAKELGVDVVKEADAFRDHATTHDRHAANWNGAFTTWLKKARPSIDAGPPRAGYRDFGKDPA